MFKFCIKSCTMFNQKISKHFEKKSHYSWKSCGARRQRIPISLQKQTKNFSDLEEYIRKNFKVLENLEDKKFRIQKFWRIRKEILENSEKAQKVFKISSIEVFFIPPSLIQRTQTLLTSTSSSTKNMTLMWAPDHSRIAGQETVNQATTILRINPRYLPTNRD